MVFGIVVGRLSDMFGHRKVYIVGVALNFIAFLLASFVTQLWQLYLTHGVLWGLSVACIYIPASGVSVQYWMHNIAFSISITGAGSGIGGFIWPNTLQAMLDSIGPRWSYRVMAISGLVVLSLCAIVLKPTVVRKAGDPKPRFFKDTDVFFKNKHYWLLSAVAFFLTFGWVWHTSWLGLAKIHVPLTHLPTLAASFKNHRQRHLFLITKATTYLLITSRSTPTTLASPSAQAPS